MQHAINLYKSRNNQSLSVLQSKFNVISAVIELKLKKFLSFPARFLGFIRIKISTEPQLL